MDKATIKEREEKLLAEVKEKLPEFYNMITLNTKDAETNIVLHQDTFGADYQEEEYTLLGKAIKSAGIYGKQVQVIGFNRKTLEPKGDK